MLIFSEEELDRLLLVVRLVLDCSSTVMVVVVGLLGSCRGGHEGRVHIQVYYNTISVDSERHVRVIQTIEFYIRTYGLTQFNGPPKS